MPAESLNHKSILTESFTVGGVTSQGSSTSFPWTPQTTCAGTARKINNKIITQHLCHCYNYAGSQNKF